MEYKTLPILTKDVGEDRTIKQLFAVMGNVDDGFDRIWPGAFTKTIAERLPRIKVLWQHDAFSPPVGALKSLGEVSRDEMPAGTLDAYPQALGALVGEVQYLDTPRGGEVLAGIKAGAITENSIGYDPVKFDFEEVAGTEWGNVRNLREVRLWDVSPVVWGMNSATTNLKSLAGTDPRLLQLSLSIAPLLAPDALKAGRVLSAANLERLKAALETLNDILSAAEPPPEDDGKALTEWLRIALAIRERELAIL